MMEERNLDATNLAANESSPFRERNIPPSVHIQYAIIKPPRSIFVDTLGFTTQIFVGGIVSTWFGRAVNSWLPVHEASIWGKYSYPYYWLTKTAGAAAGALGFESVGTLNGVYQMPDEAWSMRGMRFGKTISIVFPIFFSFLLSSEFSRDCITWLLSEKIVFQNLLLLLSKFLISYAGKMIFEILSQKMGIDIPANSLVAIGMVFLGFCWGEDFIDLSHPLTAYMPTLIGTLMALWTKQLLYHHFQSEDADAFFAKPEVQVDLEEHFLTHLEMRAEFHRFFAELNIPAQESREGVVRDEEAQAPSPEA